MRRRHSEFRVLDRRDERVQLRPVRELAHAVFVGEAGQCARVSGPPEQARRSGRGCDHVGIIICDRVVVVFVWPDFAFNYLMSIATIAAAINWIMIMLTEIKFRRVVAAGEVRMI